MPTTQLQNNKIKFVAIIISIAIIFLALAIWLTAEAHAQIDESFETYSTGDLNTQGGWDNTYNDSWTVSETGTPQAGTKHATATGTGIIEKELGENGDFTQDFYMKVVDNNDWCELSFNNTSQNNKATVFFRWGKIYFANTQQLASYDNNTWYKFSVEFDGSDTDDVRITINDGTPSEWYDIGEITTMGFIEMSHKTADGCFIDSFNDGAYVPPPPPIEDNIVFTEPQGQQTDIEGFVVPWIGFSFDYSIASESFWDYAEVDFYETTSSESTNIERKFTMKFSLAQPDITGNILGVGGEYEGHRFITVNKSYFTAGKQYLYRPRFSTTAHEYNGWEIEASKSAYFVPTGEYGYWFNLGEILNNYETVGSNSFDGTSNIGTGSAQTDIASESFGQKIYGENINIIPAILANKFPFVYLYQLQEILNGINNYYGIASESEQMASLAITFPAISELKNEQFYISVLDQEYIYKILPKATWDTIKELLSGTIVIMLIFTMWRKLKHLFTDTVDTGEQDNDEPIQKESYVSKEATKARKYNRRL
jgi:hypothetical protein